MQRIHLYKISYAGIIFITALFFFASCKKYLDKKPNTSLTVPSSLADLQALLDDATLMNQQRTPSFGEASSDEYFLKPSDFNALSPVYHDQYIWSFHPTINSNDWGYCYQPVYNANLVLDLLKNIPATPENSDEWSNVKGSALFFRSYYFLWLLWDYAKAFDSSTSQQDPGIALRLSSDFNVPTTRAGVMDCYEQVISDAKASLPLLPQYPQLVMRPSKGAAYGLLARCYLSMRDYKDALLYSDSCLQLNSNLMDYNGDADIPSTITAGYPMKQFNKETIFYTEMNLCYSTLCYTAIHARMDTALYLSFQPDDLRRQAYYSRSSDGYCIFKGSYAGSYYLFSGIATDEMYLTRAECYARTGQPEKGLSDLKTLMDKRYRTGTYTLPVNLSPDELLDTILNARAKELIMRGLRWADIKRFNKENRNIILRRSENSDVYTLEPNANYYALPLPDDIVKITGIQQN